MTLAIEFKLLFILLQLNRELIELIYAFLMARMLALVAETGGRGENH